MRWQRTVFIFVGVVIFSCFKNDALLNKSLPECPLLGYDSNKLCLLRDKQYNHDVWNYFAGYRCYDYTNNARFIKKYAYTSYYFNCTKRPTAISVPVAIVDENTIAFFNYKETESLNLLRKSFKTQELFDNYVKCCKEAEECCQKHMTNENIINTHDYCPVVWDAWSCFPKTPVNKIAKLPCTSQAYQNPDNVCTLESQKSCLWNQTLHLATWNQQTDYSTCAIAPVYLRRHNYHVIILSMCIACCFPAIIIFLGIPVFRETTRVILHRNLLIAIVIRNILTIMSKKIIIIDALLSLAKSKNVLNRNGVGCRVLTFFVSAATNCTYACMLVDGYYLHKVIVRTFAPEPRLITIYVAVAILTFLPSIIWTSVLATRQRHSCWVIDTNGEQWAVDSFRVVILLINTVLLLDIIRVMISKMKQGGTTRQTKAAFRATLFLIPLFGLHIFITAKKIVFDDTCLAEDVYDYFRYTMEASQGVFVALLFCYANTEVHNELKNALRKVTIHLHQRYGWSIGKTSTARRRTTTATYVQARESKSDF